MKKSRKQYNSRARFSGGIGLIELILAVSISGVIIAATISFVTFALQFTQAATNKVTAIYYANEAIEAVRNLRDRDWATIRDTGETPDYYYELTGTPPTGIQEDVDQSGETIGIFNRRITFENIFRNATNDIVSEGTPGATRDTDSKQIQVTIMWTEHTGLKTETVTSYLTNWPVRAYIWPFTVGGNYIYDPNKIEVAGGNVQLLDRNSDPILNGNFETGLFTNWDIESGTVWAISGSSPPQGSFYATTSGTVAQIGTIKNNPDFRYAGEQIRFSTYVSENNVSNLYVNLYLSEDNSQIASFSTTTTGSWVDNIWGDDEDLSAYENANVYIRAVDNSTTGFIQVDNFRQTDDLGVFLDNYATGPPYPWIRSDPAESVPYIQTLNHVGFYEKVGLVQGGASVRYQITDEGNLADGDPGLTWYYWNGGAWTATADLGALGQYNSASDILDNVASFDPNPGSNYFTFRMFLISNGSALARIDRVRLIYDGN